MLHTRHLRDEFGTREDRTTAEIIEIATNLKEREAMTCHTRIWPDVELTIILDKQVDIPLIDIDLNIGHGFHFKPYDNGGMFKRPGRYANKLDTWHYSGHMTLRDIVDSFQLEVSKIINPGTLTPGTWSGWHIFEHHRVPEQQMQRNFPAR